MAVLPSFLFTIGTVTGVIAMFLTFLRLTGILLAFHISLEHGLHEGYALIAPRLLVGLLGLRGLTCCCLKGLTIAVIAMAVQGVESSTPSLRHKRLRTQTTKKGSDVSASSPPSSCLGFSQLARLIELRLWPAC